MQRIPAIDSHTGGEPTRVVVEGAPSLGGGTVAEQLAVFRRDHDRFRSAVVNEPRGSDVLVGALLCPPKDPACVAGVIFFNNVGYLGMCGHGAIGVMVTLAHLGRIGPGEHRLETPVGVVTASLNPDGSVTIGNVASHRVAKNVRVRLDASDLRSGMPETVTGDVAWGGNWFFLVQDHGQPLELRRVESLTGLAWAIRRAVNAQGHPEVDHIELFGPASAPGAHARNFVLCPGRAYDRSPCGTGTSAKLACLAADGKLAEGAAWIQEGILGSRFTGKYRWWNREAGIIAPSVTGSASITGETTLLLDPKDPFCWGIRT